MNQPNFLHVGAANQEQFSRVKVTLLDELETGPLNCMIEHE